MDPMWVNIVKATIGGLMIGTAAALMWRNFGRIMGCSGIIANLIEKDGRAWRISFLIGILISPILYGLLLEQPEITISNQPWLLIMSGLLVGYGARLGSGCTSGHGVCGLARLSPRSIVAVFTFMLFGILTVFLLRQLGLEIQ